MTRSTCSKRWSSESPPHSKLPLAAQEGGFNRSVDIVSWIVDNQRLDPVRVVMCRPAATSFEKTRSDYFCAYASNTKKASMFVGS